MRKSFLKMVATGIACVLAGGLFAVLLMGSALASETPKTGYWEIPFKPSRRYLIGIATRSLYMDYFLCLQKSAQLRCQDWGVLSVTTDAMLDPELQLSQMDRFITMGVDAVILNAQDPAAILPAVKRLNEKGIPVITMDIELVGEKVDLHIAFDNFLAGKRCGEGMVKLLTERYGKPKGLVLEAMGDPRHIVTSDRSEGFHSVVDKYPEIEVIKKATDWTSAVTFEVVQSLLTAYGADVDALYMHADCQAPGGVEAIKAARLEYPKGDPERIFVVTMNGNAPTLAMMRAGRVDLLILQPVQYYGFLAVDWAIKLLEGQKVPPAGTVVDIPGEIAWCPAYFTDSKYGVGPQLLIYAPIIPDEIGVDDPHIWGNWL